MSATNRSEQASNVANSEENQLRILKYLISKGADARLSPTPSSSTRIGYHYPEIVTLIGASDGEEYAVLESLSDIGCLSRELVEKVELCPYCLHASLRLRRLCPYCRSTLIMRKEILHHFRCGWVGIEEEAASGTDLICPKCKKHLRHIGVDYERASHSYYCTICRKIFSQPLEEFLCLQCKKEIPKDDTMVQPVFAYSLTPVGIEVAKSGTFDGVAITKGIVEKDLNIYTRHYIERRMRELVNRYLRYKAGFSAVLIGIDDFERYIEENGHLAARDLVKVIAAVLRGETRGVDLPGVYDQSTFILLLPQTHHKGALVLARRFAQRMKDLSIPYLKGSPKVSIAIASCPEDGEDMTSLVEVLKQRLEECRRQGGNMIKGSE